MGRRPTVQVAPEAAGHEREQPHAGQGHEQLPGANTAAVYADAGGGGVGTDLLTTQRFGQLAE